MHHHAARAPLRLSRRFTTSIAALVGFALISPAANAQQMERLGDWTRPSFPAAEYAARGAAALAALGPNDVLLVPGGEGTSGGETFRQLDDFEYFVGLEIPRSILAIDARTRRTVLFVPGSDPRFENRDRPNDFPGRELLGDPSLQRLSGADTVIAFARFDAFVAELAARQARVLVNIGRPGSVDAGPSSPFTVRSPGASLLDHMRRTQAGLPLANGYALIAGLRMIKSPAEVARLREAARITSSAIARGAARVRAGVDERTLSGAFTADCQALGAQRDAFSPIIKAGANSLWPWRILGAHYDRRNQVLRSGELVIFDVGCERDHYVSDVGRTFPVDLHFTPRQRELVEMVRSVSDAVIAAARPGLTLAALQAVADAAIPPAARPYMQAPLYFGHHLGLSTSDPSLADATLAAGMVFTIEPWYYNHDQNVAVFIEDEILITSSGSENLTADLPRDAAGLESLRAGGAATPPALLLGDFEDDYGNAFRLSADRFEQLPSGRFQIVEWQVREQYFIAQNDAANPGDAGLWTRIDWMPLEGMSPYVWGFCMTAYRAATAEAARATPPADRSAPRVGCNGHPFSRMRAAKGTAAATATADPPRIAVMSAFDAELVALRAATTVTATRVVNGRTHYLGRLAGHDVVLMLSGFSMVNAAMTTQAVLDRYTISSIVFSGIAGGVNPGLNVGDVTIPAQWGNYQELVFARETATGFATTRVTTPFANFGMMYPQGTSVTVRGAPADSLERRFWFAVDSGALATATRVAERVQLQRCTGNSTGTGECLAHDPRIVVGGNGVSGPTFVDNAAFRKWVWTTFTADALDMETAAVAVVAYENRVPFIAFRSLSDLAGGGPGQNEVRVFGRLAAENSAAVVIEYLKALATERASVRP